MSQDYVDNVYDSTFEVQTTMANVEKNFAALKSSFSGAGAPSDPIAGMWWFDTTSNILKLRNEANNAWQSVWDFANNKPVITNLSNEITNAMCAAALKDPVAAIAGLRTLGTGAAQALPGNTDYSVANGSVTPAKLSYAVAASTYTMYEDGTEHTSITTAWAKVAEVYIPRGGAYRITFALKATIGTARIYGRIYRNGVAVGTQQSDVTCGYVTKSENISGWSAGDLLQIYIRATYAGATYKAYQKDLMIYCSDSFDFEKRQ